MKLLTDFHDYYDHAFDARLSSAPEFYRFAAGSTHRAQDHDVLQRAGFAVPARGKPAKVRAHVGRGGSVVVYTDPVSHRGDGKVLKSIDDAEKENPSDYCSHYMHFRRNESLRLLLVGAISFWLTYRSQDWRSNCGDEVTIEMAQELPARPQDVIHRALGLGYALVAIDFVAGPTGWSFPFAIDLNTAPGLRGTPVERYLTPRVVHQAISDRWLQLTRPWETR